MTPHDDAERDAWLTEALRHAPDAQAAPPSALSDAILRQARAAARDGAATPPQRPRSALAAAWGWLARPPVAAGLASVMVATLVGLMWWDRPLDETLAPPPPAQTAAAPPTAQAPSPSAPPAESADSQAAAPVPGSPSRSTDRLAPPKREAARTAKAAARRSSTEPSAGTTPQAAAEPAPFKDLAAQAKSAAAPAAADASPGAPAEGIPAPNAAPAQRLRDESVADAVRSKSQAARVLPPATPAPAAAFAPTAVAARPPALAQFLSSVTAEPERWSYRREDAAQPMTPALQAWLGRLDSASVNRWHVGPPPPGDTAPLRLLRDGTLAMTLRVADGAVWIAPNARAELPAAAFPDLERTLTEAAP